MTPFDRIVLVAAILAAFVALAWLTACWFTYRARRANAISPRVAEFLTEQRREVADLHRIFDDLTDAVAGDIARARRDGGTR